MKTQTNAQAIPTDFNPSIDDHTPYHLNDEQYHKLEAVADTLFSLTENQNPNENDRGATAMMNCLAMLCDQLDSVLKCKGSKAYKCTMENNND